MRSAAPISRPARARRPTRCARFSRSWRSTRDKTAARLVRRADQGRALRRDALWRADLRDRRAARRRRLNSPSLIAEIEDRFHRRHEELYTYASRDQEVVFVNARVAAIGAVRARARASATAASSASACKPRGKRKAFFGAWREVRRLCARRSQRRATRSRARRSSRPRPRRS